MSDIGVLRTSGGTCFRNLSKKYNRLTVKETRAAETMYLPNSKFPHPYPAQRFTGSGRSSRSRRAGSNVGNRNW